MSVYIGIPAERVVFGRGWAASANCFVPLY